MGKFICTSETQFTEYAKVIEQFCCHEDLSTFDPYDIWKTPFGFKVKNVFNNNKKIGLLPAALLSLSDTILNPILRTTYKKQEYPVVRAFAAQTLLNLYETNKNPECLKYARNHLDWLAAHPSTGYSGFCWGIGFDYPVAAGLIYDSNTPFTTNTPYPLEAFLRYREITECRDFDELISSVYCFFRDDIPVLEENDEICITAYGPRPDRIVTNAVSYTMYSLAMLLKFVPEGEEQLVREKIGKLYRFIERSQRKDGSWLYSPQVNSFVDCFHSCFILKNVIKTARMFPLADCNQLVEKGFSYILDNMFDGTKNLFLRFSVKNKPGLVKYDLYDNAEAYNLALLLDRHDIANRVSKAIIESFVCDDDIFSQVDIFGVKRQKNTLRWAVMPYLLAVSEDLRCTK